MFGISFFSNKVANQLFKRGYVPKDIPPFKFFKPVCDALKSNGYDAARAADLWDRCFKNDEVAIRELHDNSGVWGILYFGPLLKLIEQGSSQSEAGTPAHRD